MYKQIISIFAKTIKQSEMKKELHTKLETKDGIQYIHQSLYCPETGEYTTNVKLDEENEKRFKEAGGHVEEPQLELNKPTE